MPWRYLIGALIGLGIGALISYDFLIANYLHLEVNHAYILRRLPIPVPRLVPSMLEVPIPIPGELTTTFASYEIPYIFSGIMTVLVIGGGIFVINIPRLWPHRFRTLLTLVVVSHESLTLLKIGRIDFPRVLTLTFLIIWLLHLFMNEDARFVVSPAFFLGLGLIAAMLLSTVNGGLRSLWVLVSRDMKNLMLFLLLSTFLQDRKLMRHFIRVLIVVTTVSAVIGLMQEALYLHTGIPFVGQVDEVTLSLMFSESGSGGAYLRVPGFLGAPQDFGILLAIVSAIVFYLLLSPSIRLFNRRILLYLMLLPLLAALGLTFSRGAMLAFAVGCILALYLRWPSRSIQVTAALASLLVVAAILATVNPSLMRQAVLVVPQELRHGGVKIRNELTAESLEGAMERHPFIGAGNASGSKYTTSQWGWPAHNAFVLALAETGVLGLMAFSAIFAFVLIRLVCTILIGRDDWTRSVGKLLLVGCSALLIHLQFDPFFHLDALWIVWGMIEGLTTSSLRGHRWFSGPFRRHAIGPSGLLVE